MIKKLFTSSSKDKINGYYYSKDCPIFHPSLCFEIIKRFNNNIKLDQIKYEDLNIFPLNFFITYINK